MKKAIKINKALAQKVIDTVKPGLCDGLGEPEPGKMCVEAAVNYACGLPHDDSPPCVGKSVREFKIILNDQPWSTNKKRANGMIKIAIAQLGSNKINQSYFEELIVEEFANLVIWKQFDKELSKILKTKAFSGLSKIQEIGILINKYENEISELSYEELANQKKTYCPNISNDKYFILLADICLTVLKKMKSPGCKYLYLLNK